MKTCPFCSITHVKPGIYCSRSCTNKARGPRSQKTKDKQSLAALANPTGFAKSKCGGAHLKGVKRSPRHKVICPSCNLEFEKLISSTRVFCSSGCVKTGGLREKSGRAKTGRYEGVYCGSTYELAFLIYHLDNNSNIARCDKSFDYEFNGKSHKYYPDFIVDGKIYEIKGRMQEVDHVKIKVADAILIDRNNIKVYIDYVCKKFNISKYNLHTLYEEHKPKYSYICDNCGNDFDTECERTTEIKFCSNVCAGKFQQRKRKLNRGAVV